MSCSVPAPDRAEFAARVTRAQAAMSERGLAALLLTTEPDLLYFSGFLTRFWQSPTRPWFLIVPSRGDPVAVIPEIGAALMGATWITDIRTWRAPNPADDGVSLLSETLAEIVPAGATIGVPDGHETHLRMPLADWARVTAALPDRSVQSDGGLLRALQMIKSETEIAQLRAICTIGGRAFDRLPEIAQVGVPLDAVFRRFQILCLEEGADWVPYLAGAAAPQGYADVISPAGPVPLVPGDVLMLDTGAVRAGYFCDFDRNFSLGPPDPVVAAAHGRLVDAVDAALDVARPGGRVSDLYHAMDRVLTGGAGGGGNGRLGHGLGLRLTEPPSLIPDDHTPLAPGLVLTLEPVIETAPGRLMVHEENIVIRESGPELLTARAPREIRVIE